MITNYKSPTAARADIANCRCGKLRGTNSNFRQTIRIENRMMHTTTVLANGRIYTRNANEKFTEIVKVVK